MKKISLAAFCCMSIVVPAWAQNYTFPSVKDPNLTINNLFEVKPFDLNYHFTVKVSNGEYMVFEFEKLSDWKGKEEFLRYLKDAVPVVEQYRDSFKNEMTTKRLDIHVPEKEEPVISRFGQSMINSNLQATSGKENYALKMTLDTLRLIKKYPDRKFQGEMITVQYQYTFLLKDIKSAGSIINDKKWANEAAGLIDSVVLAYRKKWNNQDAWNHHLFVNFDAKEQDAEKRLLVTKQVSEQYGVKTQDMLISSVGFGASLVRGTICPNAGVGVQLNFYSDQETTFFTRLSLNTFTRFAELANNRYKAYATSFVSGEFGVEANTSNSKLKYYSLSVGFGYKLLNKQQTDRDPTMSKYMYRFFINYGLSKTITITPEGYTNFGRKDNYNGWGGISVTFRLF